MRVRPMLVLRELCSALGACRSLEPARPFEDFDLTKQTTTDELTGAVHERFLGNHSKLSVSLRLWRVDSRCLLHVSSEERDGELGALLLRSRQR